MSVPVELLHNVVLAADEVPPSTGATDLLSWIQGVVATFGSIAIGWAIYQGAFQGKGSQAWKNGAISLAAIGLVFAPSAFISTDLGPRIAGWIDAVFSLTA